MKLAYPAIFSPGEVHEEGFTVDFPDLPGCITEGRDIPEALYMAEDVLCLWILDEIEEGKELPKPSKMEDIKLEDGQFVNLILADVTAYALKYGDKLVDRTFKIPLWMNTYIDEHGIDCSKVFVEAMLKRDKEED